MNGTDTLEREVNELRGEITKHQTEAATKRAAAEKLVEEAKGKGLDPVKGLRDEDKEAFAQIDAAYKEADEHAHSASILKARLDRFLNGAAAEAVDTADGDPQHPAVRRARSMGAIVVSSKVYKDLVDGGKLTTVAGAFTTDPIQVLTKEQTANLLRGGSVRADAGDGSPLVPSHEELIPPVSIPKRSVTVLDLINVATTGRDAVTWTRQTTRTNSAGTAAFGTAVSKSRYQYEQVTSPVYRKGHYAVVDEGNIADQEEFQSIINDELMSDLRVVIEEDVLSGPGGSDWTGIYNTIGVGDVDAALAANNADALHHAITTVRVAFEMEPTAWGIDPEAFEAYWLEKGQDGHYLHHRGPQEAQVQSIWGKPASVSTAYTQPIVGDWFRGAKLWVREAVSIVIGRIDDQLLEGLWTVRAQMRGAFAVKQPKAFCKVSNFDLGS